MRRLGSLLWRSPVVAIESKAGNYVVRSKGGGDEGRRLHTLNIHLLVLVALLCHLTDDVEVLALFHLLVKRRIDFDWNPPCELLLRARDVRGSRTCSGVKMRAHLHNAL